MITIDAVDSVRHAQAVLQEEIASRRTPGVQYIHVTGDSILFRFDAGSANIAPHRPVTQRTMFNGFSVTKTFTAIAILQLADRGLLQLDAPVSKYLNDFPYPRNITVRQLLTHSAGIPNPIPLKWVHQPNVHATFNRNAFFRDVYARNPRVTAAPNVRFAYSNLGYELLGEVIEAVTRDRYEAYVTRNILEAIGIPASELGFALDTSRLATGYHRRLSMTYPMLGFLVDGDAVLGDVQDGWRAFRPYHMNGAAYGGLIGTADGFARYLQALLTPSNTLLSPQSRRTLFTENILAGGKPSGMSVSWFMGSVAGEQYFDHAGGGGGYYAELRLYPRIGRGSVLLMNRTGIRNERILDKVDRAFVEESSRRR